MRFSYEEICAFRLEIWKRVNALLVASQSKEKPDLDALDNHF